MFNMAEFLKTNLINGYWNGSFNETQINIFAMNYLLKGLITQEVFAEILEGIKPLEVEEEIDEK